MAKDYITWIHHPIGAGPFKIIKKDEKNRSVTLKRLIHQQNSANLIEFDSNEIPPQDLNIQAFSDTNPLPGKLDEVIYDSEILGFSGLFFNYKNTLANNLSFRKALSHAINREELSKLSKNFSPLSEILTTHMGRINQTKQFSLELAKKEISSIKNYNWSVPIQAVICKLPLPGSIEDKYVKKVIDQIESIGLNVKLKEDCNLTFDPNDKTSLFRFDDRGTAFKDPLVIFNAFDEGGLLSGFFPKNNSTFQILLNRSRRAGNIDQRVSSLRDLSKYFFDNDLVIPVVSRKLLYWVDKRRIKNIGQQQSITFDLSRIMLNEPG